MAPGKLPGNRCQGLKLACTGVKIGGGIARWVDSKDFVHVESKVARAPIVNASGAGSGSSHLLCQDAPMAHLQSPEIPAEYASHDLVSASELREFVYCERAWWLSRQGYVVSPHAQVERAEGIVFHEARARAARQASSSQSLWWAIILAMAALAIWLARTLLEGGH